MPESDPDPFFQCRMTTNSEIKYVTMEYKTGIIVRVGDGIKKNKYPESKKKLIKLGIIKMNETKKNKYPEFKKGNKI